MDDVRYYAAVSGNRNIYTVTSDVMDGLNVQFHSLHPVSRPAISASLIDRISIGSDADDSGFAAERTGSGWRMIRQKKHLLFLNKSDLADPAMNNAWIRYFRGKHIVLINRDATPMDSECDLVIHDKVGEVLSSLA